MFDNKNLLVFLALSTMVLLGWEYFFSVPIKNQMVTAQKNHVAKEDVAKLEAAKEAAELKDRDQLLPDSKRVKISNGNIHGSIALKGLRFDDLTLVGYRQTIDPNSGEVILLSPSNAKDAYFAETGWLAEDENVKVPTSETVWQASKTQLGKNDKVDFTWNNGQGLKFITSVEIDDHYMFTIKKRVENSSGKEVVLHQYGLINRIHPKTDSYMVSHEGPMGVFGDTLEERPYGDLEKKKTFEFKDANGWLGISDKYWLSAFIPKGENFDAKFSFVKKQATGDRVQVDFMGSKLIIPNGDKKETSVLLFTGAKKVGLLDYYTKEKDIKFFDKAVDFGMFYFMTKPMFYGLRFFQSHVVNFGLAIMLLTVVVKLLMFPLANKSYKAMSRMKLLVPEINKLKEKYGDDKPSLNKAVMELYKREKVNPMAGCLPLVIQIPVFFSLYKVIFIALEMRHAPFYGYIKDLSAPDPTTIFNLFGLLPWHNLPGGFMIGLLPIIMGFTMYIQQLLNPPATDPVQQKIMKFMPLVMVFIFAPFPAGLVIYWIWSNILSILQQYIISKGVTLRRKKKHAA